MRKTRNIDLSLHKIFTRFLLSYHKPSVTQLRNVRLGGAEFWKACRLGTRTGMESRDDDIEVVYTQLDRPTLSGVLLQSDTKDSDEKRRVCLPNN